jgi:hypothetical protein
MSQIYMWDSTILLFIVVGYPLSDIEVARPKIGILDTVSIDGYHFEINHSDIEQVNSKLSTNTVNNNG